MERRLAVILLLLLASGIALTVAAYTFGVFIFDLKIALWLRELEDGPLFTAVMTAVSALGDGWVPVIIVLAVAAVCALKKRWLEAAFVVATLSAGVLAGVLKMLVGRERPPSFSLNPNDLFQSFNQYAYPSGHVLLFVVFYGFVAYMAWKYLAGWMRWAVISVCAALIILIGPSRIYLGEHWASDVIGSYLIGSFWLIILVLLYLVVLYRRTGGMEGSPIH
ncbi:MAG: phosphatase PAP2 family protein [Methanomicrobiales archaeon]|nr:phosphatase PAP2 family protein [Methanomicrobiales archaeon]